MPDRTLFGLHITRRTLTVLLTRPISWANSGFVDEKVKQLDYVHENVKLPRRVDTALGAFIEDPSEEKASDLLRVVKWFDNVTEYHDLLSRQRVRMPSLDPSDKEVMVCISPGIGIGDELSVRPLLQALSQLPGTCHVFTSIPQYWVNLLGDVQVRSLQVNPIKHYEAIRSAAVAGAEEDVLPIFVGFLPEDMGSPLVASGFESPLVEISLNDAEIRVVDPASGTFMGEAPTGIDSIEEGLRQISRVLAPSRGASWRYSPSKPVTAESGDRLGLFLNPFTSKEMAWGPREWSTLLSSAAKPILQSAPTELWIFPGLSDRTRAFAGEIADRVQDAFGSVELIPFGAGDSGPTSSDVRRLLAMLDRTDLAFSVDTFTSHIFPFYPLLSINVCPDRDIRFWHLEESSFWIPETEDPQLAGRLAQLIVEGLRGNQPDWCPQGRLPSIRDARLEEGRGTSTVEQIVPELSVAWSSAPDGVRRLFRDLDRELSWSRLAGSWKQHDASSEQGKALAAMTQRSNFYRYCWQAARGMVPLEIGEGAPRVSEKIVAEASNAPG